MPTSRLPALLLSLLCAAAPAALLAQEATDPPATDAPAEEGTATDTPVEVPVETTDDLSLGTPADGPGSVYVKSAHGDWEIRCLRAQDGSDPCQLYQLLRDANGNAVAEVSMFPLPQGQQAVMGATFVAPLETLLTEQLRLQVDGSTAKVYPFTWCAQDGCIARIGLTAEEVESFKKGNAGTATIVPAVAPDQKVTLTISLKGFTAGHEAILAEAAAMAAPTEAPAEEPATEPAPNP